MTRACQNTTIPFNHQSTGLREKCGPARLPIVVAVRCRIETGQVHP